MLIIELDAPPGQNEKIILSLCPILRMQCIRELNEFFADFEPKKQANFIVRLKQEQ